MLPINRPRVDVTNGNQEGLANIDSTRSDINFEPSRQKDYQPDPTIVDARTPIAGTTQQIPIQKTLNFQQAGDLYRSYSSTDKDHLIRNLAGDLSAVKDAGIRTEITAFFYKADPDYGTRVAKAVNADLSVVKQRAGALVE